MGLAQGKVASLFVEFRATVNTFAADMAAISREVRAFDRILYPISQRANTIGLALSAGLTVPLVAVGALVLKTGIEFESAFAGVRKTVQASEEELANLRGELIKMSTQAPVTATEFAGIAQAAGELGLKAPDIGKFAETVAELKATTRLTSDEAANFLGRFTNITKLPLDKIHNLASTLVALGHGFAASEQEIAAFSLRIARIGSFVGLADADILAFSAALASVGVTAEAGGTAITRVFAEIDKAVLGNTTRLAQYASVAGKLPQEFANLFKVDPSAATAAFVDGLKRIKQEGGNVFTTLEALKLSNVRVRDTLLALSSGVDQLTSGLSVARNEIVANGELTRAFGERNKTTESQLKILRNQVEALGISLFDTFSPAIISAVSAMRKFVDDGIKPMIDSFNKLPASSQHFIEAMLLLAAGVGPAILAINKLVSFIGGLVLIISDLVVKFPVLISVFEALGAAVTVVVGIFAGWELENVIIDSLGLTKQFNELKSSTVELGRAVIGLVGAFGQFTIKQIIADFKEFEPVVKTVLGPIKDLVTGFALLKILQANADIKAVTKSLNELSGTTVMSTKSLTDSNSAIQAWSYNLPIMVPNMMALAKATIDHAAASGKSAEQLFEEGKAAEKLAKEHEKLLEKFKDELAPADALNRELSYLQKYFSNDQLVSVYAKKIVDAAEAQRLHGIEVTGVTEKLYAQSKAIELATEKLKDMLAEIKKIPVEPISPVPTNLIGLPATPPVSEFTFKKLVDFGNAQKEISDLGQAIHDLDFLSVDTQIALFGSDLDKAKAIAKAFHLELDPAVKALIDQKEELDKTTESTKQWDEAVKKGVKTASEMASQVASTVQAVKLMDEEGFTSSQIWEILGTEIDKAAENAKILGIALDPVVAMLAKMRAEVKENTKEAKEFDREISRLTGKIINDLANGIADAILSSGSIVKVAEKVGKDFAAAFIKAIVSNLVAPLVKEFEKLGARLADAMAKAAAAHPVVAAIVGTIVAAIAVAKALGGAHLQANQFVKETQNPFGKSLTEFVNGANKLYEAGRQTYQGAQDAQEKVKDLWKGFLDDAEKFGEKGRQQATVARQAIETLEPVIKGVLYNIQQQILALKPPSVKVFETGQSFLAYQAAIIANTDERIAALKEEFSVTSDYITYIEQRIATEQDLGNSTTDLNTILSDAVGHWNDLYAAINPMIPEIYGFAEAVRAVSATLAPDKTQEFIDKVINATLGSANLEQALGILENAKTPVGVITDRLGEDIKNFADALTLAGQPIPELINKYLALTLAQEELSKTASKASGEVPRIANSLSKLVGSAVDSLRDIAGGGDLSKGILDALTKLLTGLPPVNPAVPNPATMQVTITIEDHEQITNTFMFTEEISRQQTRDDIIPEITEALTNNTDSVQEKWTRILQKAWNGVVTT